MDAVIATIGILVTLFAAMIAINKFSNRHPDRVWAAGSFARRAPMYRNPYLYGAGGIGAAAAGIIAGQGLLDSRDGDASGGDGDGDGGGDAGGDEGGGGDGGGDAGSDGCGGGGGCGGGCGGG